MYSKMDLRHWNKEVQEKALEVNEAEKMKGRKEQKLPATHVFNEDLSVKENRRLLEEHNKQVRAKNLKRASELGKLKTELFDLMVEQLVSENSTFNKKQVEYVFSKVREDENVYDWHFSVTCELEYIEEVINLGIKSKKKK